MSEYSHLSEPDPELAPYVAMLKALPAAENDGLNTRRAALDTMTVNLQKFQPSELPPVTKYRVSEHHVDVAGGTILARSLVPTSDSAPGQTFPLMVWLHGGAWTMGSLEIDDYKLRAVCVESQISILNVEYRSFHLLFWHPIVLNDCYTALKWAAEKHALFSANLSKGFIIAGLSAGAHLAAVIAHRARDDPFFEDRKITGQILQIESLCHTGRLRLTYLIFSEQLGGSAKDPEVSPFRYPSHKGLAPALIQVCGMDPLRDEALLYAKALKSDGVKTELRVYPGIIHAFQYAYPAFKSAIKWNDEYRMGLEWLLKGAPDSE
ncbi:Alpha/Beta hydrolase protein [Mycena rebaudengoi]|nr:Alpha/Beta hydrolase protein [Mycena rebaudengoi]